MNILNFVGAGWCDVVFKDDKSEFRGSASYLEDVPFDFLFAFSDYIDTKRMPIIECDEEGSEFIIISTEYDTYVISERDETRTYKFDMRRKEFMKVVVEDIKEQIDMAVDFVYSDYTEDERMRRKKEMLKIINKIERYLKNGK